MIFNIKQIMETVLAKSNNNDLNLFRRLSVLPSLNFWRGDICTRFWHICRTEVFKLALVVWTGKNVTLCPSLRISFTNRQKDTPQAHRFYNWCVSFFSCSQRCMLLFLSFNYAFLFSCLSHIFSFLSLVSILKTLLGKIYLLLEFSQFFSLSMNEFP